MDSLAVDMTYGEGLFQAAVDLEIKEEVRDELDLLCKIFQEQPKLFELLKTPTLSGEEKKELARSIFEGKISQHLLNFLCVLIDKRRVFNFEGITKAYKKLHDDSEGVSKGEVFSVLALGPEEIENLEKQTSDLIRKKVRLKNKIDTSLIGGVKIYIDGKLIDGSIKRRLQELKEVLI